MLDSGRNTSAADDFSAFDGNERMFFGLVQPFAMIRSETEAGLRKQAADTVVTSIVTHDQAKFLTVLKKATFFRKHSAVSRFGFCVRATLALTWNGGKNQATVSAVLTFVFADAGKRGLLMTGKYVDLDGDAARAFRDEVFRERFLESKL